ARESSDPADRSPTSSLRSSIRFSTFLKSPSSDRSRSNRLLIFWASAGTFQMPGSLSRASSVVSSAVALPGSKTPPDLVESFFQAREVVAEFGGHDYFRRRASACVYTFSYRSAGAVH